MRVLELIDSDNHVFRAYAFWSTVLALKMLAMALWTGKERFRKMVFSNPEDVKGKKAAKVKFDDPDVERIRRAHRNDLENLVPFFVIGFLYVLTKPNVLLAVNLIRLVAFSRILHTIVYAGYKIGQPARGLTFVGGMFPTFYMLIEVVRSAC